MEFDTKLMKILWIFLILIKEKSWILILLVKKNLLIRKKNWIVSIVIQLMIPICLILLSELVRQAPINNETCGIIGRKDFLFSSVNENKILKKGNGKKIYFTPELNITKEIIKHVGDCLNTTNTIGYPDEKSMTEAIESEEIGIIFETIIDNSLPKNFKYRLKSSSILPIYNLYNLDSDDERKNLYNDWIPVQLCIDKAFINLSTNNTEKNIKTSFSIQQMPYSSPEHVKLYKKYTFYTLLIEIIIIIVASLEISFPANEKHAGIDASIKNKMNKKLKFFCTR